MYYDECHKTGQGHISPYIFLTSEMQPILVGHITVIKHWGFVYLRIVFFFFLRWYSPLCTVVYLQIHLTCMLPLGDRKVSPTCLYIKITNLSRPQTIHVRALNMQTGPLEIRHTEGTWLKLARRPEISGKGQIPHPPWEIINNGSILFATVAQSPHH